jgi:hypothetical protein
MVDGKDAEIAELKETKDLFTAEVFRLTIRLHQALSRDVPATGILSYPTQYLFLPPFPTVMVKSPIISVLVLSPLYNSDGRVILARPENRCGNMGYGLFSHIILPLVPLLFTSGISSS